MPKKEVALDFLLEGFIDDALVEQCRNIKINGLVQDNRKARSGNLFICSLYKSDAADDMQCVDLCWPTILIKKS